MPTASAIKSLSFDISVCLTKVAAEWPFPGNGAERIDTALVKVGICHLKRVSKSRVGLNGQ